MHLKKKKVSRALWGWHPEHRLLILINKLKIIDFDLEDYIFNRKNIENQYVFCFSIDFINNKINNKIN